MLRQTRLVPADFVLARRKAEIRRYPRDHDRIAADILASTRDREAPRTPIGFANAPATAPRRP